MPHGNGGNIYRMMRITPLLLFVAPLIVGCQSNPLRGVHESQVISQFGVEGQSLSCDKVEISALQGSEKYLPQVSQLFMRMGYQVQTSGSQLFSSSGACFVEFSAAKSPNPWMRFDITIREPSSDSVAYSATITVDGLNPPETEVWQEIGNKLSLDLAR